MSTLYEKELEAARKVDVENMSYEQLQDLCDKIGTVKKGVSRDTFARIPTRVLTTSNVVGGGVNKNDANNRAATSSSSAAGSSASSSAAPANSKYRHEACCICMTELLEVSQAGGSSSKQSSKIKSLPCKHTFHAQCIKVWLSSHTSCPVCKADVAKQAASVGSLLCQLM